MILIYKKMLLSISEEKKQDSPKMARDITFVIGTETQQMAHWLTGGYLKNGLEDVIAVAEVSPRTFCSVRLRINPRTGSLSIISLKSCFDALKMIVQ